MAKKQTTVIEERLEKVRAEAKRAVLLEKILIDTGFSEEEAWSMRIEGDNYEGGRLGPIYKEFDRQQMAFDYADKILINQPGNRKPSAHKKRTPSPFIDNHLLICPW